MKNYIICASLTALILMGCRDEVEPVSSPPISAAPASAVKTNVVDNSPLQAQPKLQTIKLWVGTNELTTELAVTLKQIETGMMWRTNMEEMEAMLFVFPRPYQTSFWMKNTLLPLSCAYINPEGIIMELHEMKPKDESPIPAASDQIQYVLEVKEGWFKRHDVTEGMLVKTERGTLRETFFRR